MVRFPLIFIFALIEVGSALQCPQRLMGCVFYVIGGAFIRNILEIMFRL